MMVRRSIGIGFTLCSQSNILLSWINRRAWIGACAVLLLAGLGNGPIAWAQQQNVLQPALPPQAVEELPTSDVLTTPDGSVKYQLEQFEQRLKELETAHLAQESATRTIIQQSLASRGSNIMDTVQFGGTIETLALWERDFNDVAQSDILLDTAEIDFAITPNDWSAGRLVMTYDQGDNVTFPTSQGGEEFIDRVNVRQALIIFGNPLKYPLYSTVGRDVVPFGVSNGDPVTSNLSIVDPLTIEVFEMREDFVMFSFVAPIYCPPPVAPNPPAIPRVRPMLFNPLARRAATSMCDYCPCNPPIAEQPLYAPPFACVSPYSGSVYFFNGDTTETIEDHITQMGGTLGYFTKGSIGPNFPWTLDCDVDVTSSVFDSDFLQFEYRPFLDQIGFVPGMAAHIKSNLGPTAVILEWNGAIANAEFIDDVGTPVDIRPQAWQVQFLYQFDWNPYVEVIGAQGTYFVIGYSESSDLGGVQRVIGLEPPIRVGTVPEKRFSVGVGEWVLENVRIAFEYSHAVDYSVAEGGTGNSADAVLCQFTLEW